MGNVEDLNILSSSTHSCAYILLYFVVRYLGNAGDGGAISRTFAMHYEPSAIVR